VSLVYVATMAVLAGPIGAFSVPVALALTNVISASVFVVMLHGWYGRRGDRPSAMAGPVRSRVVSADERVRRE
jgi:hypothetical protein